MTDALRETVIRAVRAGTKAAPGRPIDESTRFVEDLGLDSLDLVSVMLQVEEAVGREIDPDAVPTFRSVGDVVAYLATGAAVASAA